MIGFNIIQINSDDNQLHSLAFKLIQSIPVSFDTAFTTLSNCRDCGDSLNEAYVNSKKILKNLLKIGIYSD